MKLKKFKPLILIVLIITLVLLGRTFNIESFKVWIISFGILAPLIHIIIYIIATITFLPATPFTLLGGAVFGPILGTIYTLIGASIGSTIAFLLARNLGEEFVEKHTDSTKIQKYNEKIKKNGFITVLLLRLIPLFPFNGLNLGLGITKIKTKDYILGTLGGMIPGTFFFTYAGYLIYKFGSSENIFQQLIKDPTFYIFIITLMIVIIIPSIYIRKKKNEI